MADGSKTKQGNQEIDWSLIRTQYETGAYSTTVLAEMHGLKPRQITAKATLQKWKRSYKGLVEARTNQILEEEAQTIANQLPSLSTDVPAQARMEIEISAAMRAQIIMGQQEHLAKLSITTNKLLDKVSKAVAGEEVGKTVQILRKGLVVGESTTYDFLGANESLSDAVNKIAQATAKIIPLTRTVFKIDENKDVSDPISELMNEIDGRKGLIQEGAGDLGRGKPDTAHRAVQ